MSEWLQIESAPKGDDKTCVLLWDGSAALVGYWLRLAGGWVMSDGDGSFISDDRGDAYYIHRPTHWMPLPNPPSPPAR